MTEPVLSGITKQRLDAVLRRPPHGLLLTGPPGAGKESIARWLSAQLLQTTEAKLEHHPYFLTLQPEGASISIDAVRAMERRLGLKVPLDQPVNRIVYISAAETLGEEAQNALLKTLEEPPVGTLLLLSSGTPDALLPTVRSRLQTVTVTIPPRMMVEKSLRGQGVAESDLQRIMAMSGGLPALAFSLARSEAKRHPLANAAATARELLQATTFGRLSLVDMLAKDKVLSRQVVGMLMQMSHTALLGGKATTRWRQVMTAAYEADTSLERGAQPKLVLSRLMLTL